MSEEQAVYGRLRRRGNLRLVPPRRPIVRPIPIHVQIPIGSVIILTLAAFGAVCILAGMTWLLLRAVLG